MEEQQSCGINARIEKILDEKIRPALARDNGGVETLSFAGGVLKVKTQGRCGSCPSAAFEIEQMIMAELRTAIPGVDSVVVVSGVSGELLEAARALMGQNRES